MILARGRKRMVVRVLGDFKNLMIKSKILYLLASDIQRIERDACWIKHADVKHCKIKT